MAQRPPQQPVICPSPSRPPLPRCADDLPRSFRGKKAPHPKNAFALGFRSAPPARVSSQVARMGTPRIAAREAYRVPIRHSPPTWKKCMPALGIPPSPLSMLQRSISPAVPELRLRARPPHRRAPARALSPPVRQNDALPVRLRCAYAVTMPSYPRPLPDIGLTLSPTSSLIVLLHSAPPWPPVAPSQLPLMPQPHPLPPLHPATAPIPVPTTATTRVWAPSWLWPAERSHPRSTAATKGNGNGGCPRMPRAAAGHLGTDSAFATRPTKRRAYGRQTATAT
jgi:hypothetical protein